MKTHLDDAGSAIARIVDKARTNLRAAEATKEAAVIRRAETQMQAVLKLEEACSSCHKLLLTPEPEAPAVEKPEAKKDTKPKA